MDGEQQYRSCNVVDVLHLSTGGVTDHVAIMAALLHDTVEDTDTTLDEIEHKFGKEMRG